MRRLALLVALLALPVSAAEAKAPMRTTTWVVERVSSDASDTLTVRGGAGADEHEWAMAAVAAASVGQDGRFTFAEGGLFFGAMANETTVTSPAGETRCSDVSAVKAVCLSDFGAGIGFAIVWSKVTFNRAFVVLRGRAASIDLGEDGTRGWRYRRWTGPVRILGDDGEVSAAGPVGTSTSTFTDAEAAGGPGGSIAIGHLPCRGIGYTNTGSGAARLRGGTKDVVATCADWYPPASYNAGGAEWTFSGAATGVSDVPARLVVIQRPVPRTRR